MTVLEKLSGLLMLACITALCAVLLGCFGPVYVGDAQCTADGGYTP